MTTTVRARRTPGQQIMVNTPTPEAAREVARVLRGSPPPDPRPLVPYERHRLFIEPAYEDGKPYAADDEDDMGDSPAD